MSARLTEISLANSSPLVRINFSACVCFFFSLQSHCRLLYTSHIVIGDSFLTFAINYYRDDMFLISNIHGLVVKLDLMYAKRFLFRGWLRHTASH